MTKGKQVSASEVLKDSKLLLPLILLCEFIAKLLWIVLIQSTWILPAVYLRLTAPLICLSTQSSFLGLLSLPLRWILGAVFFPLVVCPGLLAARTLYLLAGSEGFTVQLVTGSSVLLFYCWFVYMASRVDRNSGKIREYSAGIVQTQRDLISFLALVVVVCCLVRIPKAAKVLGAAKNFEEFNSICNKEATKSVVDVLCLLPLLILIFLPWRLPRVRNLVKNTYGDLKDAMAVDAAYSNSRRIIWAEAGGVLIDAPFYLFSLPILLTVYRAAKFLREFRGTDEMAKKRWLCLKHSWTLLLDLPAFVAVAVILLIGIYRLPNIVQMIRSGETADAKRAYCYAQVLEVLKDIPALIAAMVVVLTVYRFPLLVKRLLAHCATKTEEKGQWRFVIYFQVCCIPFDLAALVLLPFALASIYLIGDLKIAWDKHWNSDKLTGDDKAILNGAVHFQVQVAVTVGTFVSEMPSTLLALIMFGTFWRAGHLFRTLKAKKSHQDRARECFDQFAEWVVDLPFVVFFLLTFILAVWRVPLLLRDLCLAASQKQARLVCFLHFRQGLVDIPLFAMILVLTVTIYRLPVLIKKTSRLQPVKDKDEEKIDDKEPFGKFHKAAAEQFLELLIDIPFVLLAGLCSFTFWRLPYLVSGLRNADPSAEISLANQRRRHALKTFTLSFADFICSMCAVLILCTGYRISIVHRYVRSLKKDKKDAFSIHRFLFCQTKTLILDIPFIIIGVCTIPFCWRFIQMWQKLKSEATITMKRKSVLKGFILGLLDVPALFVCFFICGTLWRVFTFFRKVKSIMDTDNWSTTSRLHGVVFQEGGLALLQIWCTPFIFVTFWRLPLTLKLLMEYDSHESDFIERLKVVLFQDIYIFLDLVALLIWPVSLLTRWRVGSEWKVACNILETEHKQKGVFGLNGLSHGTLQFYTIYFTAKAVGLLCMDLVYGFLFAIGGLCFWRVREMKNKLLECSTYSQRIGVAAKYASFTILAVPHSLFFLIILCGPRRKEILSGLSTAKDTEAFYSDIRRNFLVTLLQAAALVLSLLVLWRCPVLLSQFKKKKAQGSLKGIDILRMPLQQLWEILTDVCIGMIILLPYFILWRHRVPWLHEDLNELKSYIEFLEKYKPICVVWLKEGRDDVTDSKAAICAIFIRWRRLEINRLRCLNPKHNPQRTFLLQAQIDKGLVELTDVVLRVLSWLLLWRRHLAREVSSSDGTVRQKIKKFGGQVAAMAGDLLWMCFVLFTALCNPWRALWLLLELVHALNNDVARFHKKMDACVAFTWAAFPSEVCVLVLSIVFAHRLLWTIQILLQNPFDPAFRTSNMHNFRFLEPRGRAKNVQEGIQLCYLELLILLTSLLLLSTLWRIPSSLFDLRIEAPNVGDVTHVEKRRCILKILAGQCLLLLLDCLQALEVVFVIGTVNQGASFVRRSFSFFKTGYMKHFHQSISKFIPEQKLYVHQTKQQIPLGTFQKIPKQILLQEFFWLTPSEICSFQVNQTMSAVVDTSRYWLDQYEKEFGKIPVNERTVQSPKTLYCEEFKRRRPTRTKALSDEEIDYIQGYRYIIHSEFLQSWVVLGHSFVIPLKLAGYLTLPVQFLADFRYSTLRSPFSSNEEEFIYRGLLLHTAKCSWWQMHRFFFNNLWILVLAYSNEVALIMTFFNTVLLFFSTMGGPLWMKAVGRDGLFLVDILFGLVMPAFIALQVMILFAPTFLYYTDDGFIALEYVKDYIARLMTGVLSFLNISYSSLKVVEDFSIIEYVKAMSATERLTPFSTCYTLLFYPIDLILHGERMLLTWIYKIQFFPVSKAFQFTFGFLSSRWMIQILWVVVWGQSQRFSRKMIEKLYPRHDSLMLYKLPFKLLLVQIFFCFQIMRKIFVKFSTGILALMYYTIKTYDGILASAVRVLRKRNIFTELILVLIILGWVAWPLAIPYHFINSRFLQIPAWLLVIILVVRSRIIILKNWA